METLNGKLSELENLKSDLEKELLELKRPAGGAQNKLATEHKEAFVGFLRKGREDGLRDLERKALQVGTDEDGGYAVPEELDRNILNLLKDEVVMRQEATVITVGGSDYKKLVNLGGTASGWVGETDTRSQTATSRLELIEPLMGKFTATRRLPRKCWTMPSSTWRLDQQRAGNRICRTGRNCLYLRRWHQEAERVLAYESTDETDKVRAFGKLQHIVSGEATAVTADAIIKLIYTLRKAHRTGAKFMMNNNSLFAIRLLKDTEGNYLWRLGWNWGSHPLWRVTVSLKTSRCRILPRMRKPLHLVTSNGVTPSLTVSVPAFFAIRTPINRLSVFIPPSAPAACWSIRRPSNC